MRRVAYVVGLAVVRGWDLQLFSPAKINLFLRVMGKRDDGFHELASLFQAIDLGDMLRIRALPPSAQADEFECDIEGLSSDNLVTRAFALYRERTQSSTFFRARLEKNTPVEAGLGGGSSNAATALYAANELCGLASPEELIDMSGALGSDITFFLGPTGTAYCTGRGEIIEPLDPLASQRLYVVKPQMGLSTPLVFKTLAKSNYATLSPVEPRDLLANFAKGPGPQDYVNDLEAPAFELEPTLLDIKAKLLDQYPAAMMSGSGTSLFAVLGPGQAASADFPAQFRAACEKDLGIRVAVFEVGYATRQGFDSWYAVP